MEIHLAPLQGYTDNVYRRILDRMCGGVEVYYTPFIRWEKGSVRGKDVVDILPEKNEGLHLIPQIICGTVDDMNRLCDVVEEKGYREIDINMGCPAPMQTKLKRGSGILPFPEAVEALCLAMREREEVNFSVKMRLGMDSREEWREVMPILNGTRLQHITIHPRLASQMYKGEVDMEEFARAAELCRHPLIYNGDIRTREDIRRLETAFPNLRAVMIGRGLLARPTLAAEYHQGVDFSDEKRIAILMAMHEEMLRFCTEKYKVDSQILLHMHAFWEYQEGLLGRKAWKKIMKAGSMKNYLVGVGGCRL